MKKFVYLCGMMLLSLNMMAQIDLNDTTWRMTYGDNFTGNDTYWGSDWTSRPHMKWRGYPGWGVTTQGGFQVYQYSNCHFCPNEGKMKIVAEYCDTIWKNTYLLPANLNNNYPPSDSLFYFSGDLEALKDSCLLLDTLSPHEADFRFGYFEIRCKLPENPGAHTAFWLQGASVAQGDPYYEEIDIFEYTWALGDPKASWLVLPNPKPTEAGDPFIYSTAICHNLRGDTLDPYTDGYGIWYPHIDYGPGVTGWHTYACEWMPDYVYWYFDGHLVNSYFDKKHIPQHPLTLKTSYAIDVYATDPIYSSDSIVIGHVPDWMGSDTMYVDYIKVYQLKCDCNTDELITCQNELNGYQYSVKNSVSIAPTNGIITVGNTDQKMIRVVESFRLSGPFEANRGCEFTVIRQDCPE